MSDRAAGAGLFAGTTAWLITDGAAGGIAQLKGVALALGAEPVVKQVSPHWPWRLLAPWGPVAPSERFGREGSAFASPWPAIAIATARQTIPYIRALRRVARGETFTVILQDPRTSPAIADLVATPAHDRVQGPNVLKTLTSPNPFSPSRLAGLREGQHPEIDALPRPRIAVIVGGPNAVYRYSSDDCARLAKALRGFAKSGGSFLVTASRRTPPHLRDAVADAVSGAPHIFWDGTGDNPYPHFLARADLFVVTADSVNMASDACATGKPIYVFTPEGGSPKFDRFHSALRDYGATRSLPDMPTTIETWSYVPLDAAAEIAREIERRARQAP